MTWPKRLDEGVGVDSADHSSESCLGSEGTEHLKVLLNTQGAFHEALQEQKETQTQPHRMEGVDQ